MSYNTDCLQEKDSSSWLTYLPIERHGFVLHNGAFIDAMIGHLLGYLLTVFVVVIFRLLMHLAALTVPFLPSDITTFVTSLQSEICHDVKIEHYLQPLTGENLRYKAAVSDDDARLESVLLVYWVIDINMHFLLFVCLIP